MIPFFPKGPVPKKPMGIFFWRETPHVLVILRIPGLPRDENHHEIYRNHHELGRRKASNSRKSKMLCYTQDCSQKTGVWTCVENPTLQNLSHISESKNWQVFFPESHLSAGLVWRHQFFRGDLWKSTWWKEDPIDFVGQWWLATTYKLIMRTP